MFFYCSRWNPFISTLPEYNVHHHEQGSIYVNRRHIMSLYVFNELAVILKVGCVSIAYRTFMTNELSDGCLHIIDDRTHHDI